MTVPCSSFISLPLSNRANFENFTDENEARALRVRGVGVRVTCARRRAEINSASVCVGVCVGVGGWTYGVIAREFTLGANYGSREECRNFGEIDLLSIFPSCETSAQRF